MAYTSTKQLTAPQQSRKRHTVYRNGKIVRVYYTDNSSKYNTGGGDKTKKMIHVGKNHKGNGAKGFWQPTQAMINEFRSYGRDFIQQKYKLSTNKLNFMAKTVAKAVAGRTAPVAQQGFVAKAGRLMDGGPGEGANDNAAFKRKMMLNLENDSDLAQGSHHEWAQPTSISSLITSQLRQSQNAPADYFDAWAQSKGGTTQLLARDSSSFGLDVSHTPQSSFDATQDDQETIAQSGKMTMQAESDPMGAFSTSMVMDPFYAEQEDGGSHAGETPEQHAAHMNAMLDAGDGADGQYNPWAEGEGGANNSYGPSAQTMAAGTMEAMALANAYFAPQRMELAYQLGDMETDMRRLAVNLGRQVDDPVLQAKLYKEGMRAVRTMDVQQNTMAFQMAEQRRREELQNFQFYDQLAQNEYQTRLNNQQFMADMELKNQYYELQYKQLEYAADAAAPPQANTSPVDGTENSPVGGQAPAPTQTPKPTSPTIKPATGSGIGNSGGNLLGGINPQIYAALS